MSNTSSQIARGFKFLGFYQIVGGLIGFILLFWLIEQQTEVSIWVILLLLFVFLLYAYSIFCGVLLLKKKSSGLKHSTINQFLQLVSFAILGYSYQYGSGIIMNFGLDLTKSVEFNYFFGVSSWSMSFNSDPQNLVVNINLVALLLIIYISKLKVKVETQLIENRISNIGEATV